MKTDSNVIPIWYGALLEEPFRVALGPIVDIRRIWANGKQIYPSSDALTFADNGAVTFKDPP